MDLIPGRERLEGYFTALGLHESMPWLRRYPWELFRWRRGEYLCRYGESVPRLLLLLSGKVAVSITPPHGRTHLITYCAPGDLICGDVEVALGNTQATADLRAEEGDAYCASISIAAHREALMDDPDFLRCAVRRLAREMVKDSLYSANNLLFPVEERLGAYLVNTAQNGIFRGNLTRLSELFGVSYRQVSRVMKSFLERGWLERTGDGWRILRPEPLERMAELMDQPPE